MSKKDLQRIEVLTEVLAGGGRRSRAQGALNISLRQTQRLQARYEDGEGAARIHKALGRSSISRMLSAMMVDRTMWAIAGKRYSLPPP